MIQKVNAKLGNMRKSVEWVVYPVSKGPDANPNMVVIQSDKRIAQIDVTTRKGRLSKSYANGAYFVHLALGAETVEVPQELVDQILAARPKTGDQIGPGIYVG